MKQVIIPVIVSARELDAKLLIALYAARHGIDSVIGSHTLINLDLHKFRPGVYVCPSLTAGSERISTIARKLGHATVAFDEAGLVWHDAESYRTRRASVKTLANLDVVFAWGNEQARALEPVARGLPVDIVATGHPRLDLLRPEIRAVNAERVEGLRREHGDFILITSSFGWVNDRLPESADPSSEERFHAIAKASAFTLDYVRHAWKMFQAFLALIPALARRFPERTIVVRPHPAENVETWRKAADGLSNVVVRTDFDIVAWLSAAGHLVHSGSTTAVEAAIVGLTPIYYQPFPPSEFDFPQSRAASVAARDEDDLFAQLGERTNREGRPADLLARLEDMVAPQSGAPASEQIAARMNEMFESGDAPRGSTLARLAGKAASISRKRRKLGDGRDEASTTNPSSYEHKFPAIATEDLQRRVDDYSARLGLKAPTVSAFSDRIFRISPT